MRKMIHPGIGDRFSMNRRRWIITDLCEKVYTCKTIDKKVEVCKTFSLEDISKYVR
jgi:hypothetical protein